MKVDPSKEDTMIQEQLDIVIPMYNPPKGWSAVLIERLQPIFEKTNLLVKVILVNDGSNNGNVVPEIDNLTKVGYEIKVVQYSQNQGKGYALRQGVLESTAKYLMLTDIDIPFTEESMWSIIKSLELNNADLALGQRDDSYYENIPSSRKRMSKWLSVVNSKIFRLPVKDTQCGLKGLNKKGKEIFLKTTIKRYLFDLEMVFLASKNKDLKLIPVPVILRPGIQLSSMRLKVIMPELMNFFKIVLNHWN
jgi:glycosyltransferase involved in cell wall biosynthesis